MAYMRGDNYLWSDGNRLHVWVADGYDGWDEAGWHRVDDGDEYPVDPAHLEAGTNTASGVSISQETVDEYVMMRLAELISKGLDEDAMTRAVAKWAREPLKSYADKIRAALESIKDD